MDLNQQIFNFYKSFFKKEAFTVCWNNKYYQVNLKERKIEELSEITRADYYIFEFDTLTQDFIKVPLIARKNLKKIVSMQLATEKGLIQKDYYIYFEEVREVLSTTEEKSLEISVVYFTKDELRRKIEENPVLNVSTVLIFEFLLSAMVKGKKPKVVFWVDVENERIISLLVKNAFPVEIIKDVVSDPVTYIVRTFSYFQGKYNELAIEDLLIIGMAKDYQENLQNSIPAKIEFFEDPLSFLFEVENTKVKIQSFLGIFESLSLPAVKSLLVLLIIANLVKFGNLIWIGKDYFSTLRQFKAMEKSLQKEYTQLEKKLKSQAFKNKIKEVSPYLGFNKKICISNQILEIVDQINFIINSLASENIIFKTFELKRKKGSNCVYEITIEGSIKGTTRREITNRASEVKEAFKEVGGHVRFSRRPPRPPITGFTVTIRRK